MDNMSIISLTKEIVSDSQDDMQFSQLLKSCEFLKEMFPDLLR